MQNKDFVHLHVHGTASNFDGLAPISKLVMRARKMGFEALALTDHGNVGGLITFVNECKLTQDKKGNDIPYPILKPLLGEEFYMSSGHTNKSKELQPRMRKGNHHLVLIATNFKGYQNLCRLSHKSWIDGFYMDPRIDFDLLSTHSEGLICSTACLAGLVNSQLMYDRYDLAKKTCGIFKEIFGERFFLEVMYHGIRMEQEIMPDILKLGRELSIKVIASCDCHYIDKKQADSHEMFMCMSTGKCMKDPNRLKFPYPEFYLKSADEMLKIFKNIPYVLTNTKLVADMVDDEDIDKNLFGGMKLPKFDLPEGKTAFQYLKELSIEGMKELGFDKSKPHIEALKKELGDIKVAWENNGYDFATYFLIVWDIINFAKKNDIMTGPGRGSGFGSILLKCLGVTWGADPIEYGLLWERFLAFAPRRVLMEKDFGF